MIASLTLVVLAIALVSFGESTQYQTRKPTRFSVDPAKIPDLITSSAGLVFRLGSGAFVQGWSPKIASATEEKKDQYTIVAALGQRLEEDRADFNNRPQKPVELYEFESCPYCKKVREAVTILDIDVAFYPCPKGGGTFREKVISEGGKAQFPYLKDPNTGVAMYESEEIIQYLYDTYGDGKEVPTSLLGNGATVSASLAMLLRMGKGSNAVPSTPPAEPITLWAYEASPFCKIVRERLVELEIPHIQKTCARGSAKRQELFDKTGTFQVPYIEDPNTGVNLFESSDILAYLDDKYAK
jgi:glutathione S-transferase